MSTPIQFRLTAVGQQAAWNAHNTGLSLELTHVQFGSGNRAPNGSETALLDPKKSVPIAAGNRVSASQIRLSAMLTGADSFSVSEIGIWKGVPGQGGSVLFAYWSQASGSIAAKAPGVDFIFSHDMALGDAVAAGSVTVQADTSQSAMLAMMAAHEAKLDPHTGYMLESALELPSVPLQKVAPVIVVTQPHLRVMVWDGARYVRAPWHQPCQMFFSYDNPASIPGALPVRGDVSYQQANYPDLVARLGLSGSGTFTLTEARGEFIRVLDNGRGVDVNRPALSYQGGTNLPTAIYGGSHAGQTGKVNAWWSDQMLISTSGLEEVMEIRCDVEATGALITAVQNPSLNYPSGVPSLRMAKTRPRNVAFALWITY